MTLRGLLPIIVCGSLLPAVCGANAQAGTTPSPFAERYRLEQHGGGLGVQVDESVVVLALERPNKPTQWVMERQRRDRNWCGNNSAGGQCVAADVTVHDWASSSTCPFLYIYVEGFSDFKETGRDRPPILVTDTPLITLEFAPSAAGGKPPQMLGEYVGPLATWWRNTEDGIKNCWTAAPPVIDGYTLEARLPASKP